MRSIYEVAGFPSLVGIFSAVVTRVGSVPVVDGGTVTRVTPDFSIAALRMRLEGAMDIRLVA
jgi:hypothetical protein